MKRLNHYIPNYILTIVLVLLILATAVLGIVSNFLLKPSFYISSVERNNIYQRVTSYTENYFEKSYGASGIPAEVYMEGLSKGEIKKAVDGQIEAFFDYVNSKAETTACEDIDLSSLENSLTDYFNEFAVENNVDVNEEFTNQLEKTIESAKKDIMSFTNIFMLDYMEKLNAPQLMRKMAPIASAGFYCGLALTAIFIVLLIVMNKKELKAVFYWLGVSCLCSGLLMLVPGIIANSSGYFNKLILRTDYIYYSVTGVLHDAIKIVFSVAAVILIVSLLMLGGFFIACKVSSGKAKEN